MRKSFIHRRALLVICAIISCIVVFDSKCFRMSQMNCSTCHNTHIKESANLVAYAMKCMQCHTESNHNACSMQPPAGFSMTANCVNCHMPVKASRNLTLLVAEQGIPSPEFVRSHLIAVYPAESKGIAGGKGQ